MSDTSAALNTILETVWNAALDAGTSEDFRPNGRLNEEAYLRYQRNVFTKAAEQIRSLRIEELSP